MCLNVGQTLQCPQQVSCQANKAGTQLRYTIKAHNQGTLLDIIMSAAIT
jgi:hypothetical protein